jgi:hypothetical protein
LHLPPGVLGNRDTARFGDALDTSCDIDAVAKKVVALDDDVADVDADSELDRIGFITGALPKLFLNSMAQVTASTALAMPMRREYPTTSADRIAASLLLRRSSAMQTAPPRRPDTSLWLVPWSVYRTAMAGDGSMATNR